MFDNVSLHILDMGFGPDCLLTFHKIDDEQDIRDDEIRDRNPSYLNGNGTDWTPEMQRSTAIMMIINNSIRCFIYYCNHYNYFILISRSGIVGRILWGVVQKIYLTIKVGGAVISHGELIDSTAYLATTIIALIHNFGMNALGSLDIWIDHIEKGLKDITVSKHIFHIRECAKICKEMGQYIYPFNKLANEMQVVAGKCALRCYL